MENRNGLLIEFTVESADGYAERKSARALLETELPGSRRITLGAAKGYDTAAFVAACRALKVTPHIARNERRGGAPGGLLLVLHCRFLQCESYGDEPHAMEAQRRRRLLHS